MGAVAQGVAGRWPVFLERGCGPGVCKASLVSRVRDEVTACWAGGGSRDVGGQTQRVRVAGRPRLGVQVCLGSCVLLCQWESCCSHGAGGVLWPVSILPGQALRRTSYGYVGKEMLSDPAQTPGLGLVPHTSSEAQACSFPAG